MKIDVAVSNSFGFGGTNGTLVFRRLGSDLTSPRATATHSELRRLIDASPY